MKLFGKKEEVRIRNPHFDDEDSGYAFRRSRTLTGTLSSSVRAAGESKAQLKSPRLKEHELKRHRNMLALGLFGAVIVTSALAWLVSEFTAGNVEIRSKTQLSSSSIDASRYQQRINGYFASRPLERFRFVLKEDVLLAYIQRESPEVKAISLDGTTPGRSAATLTFREPIVGWQIRDTFYYIDGEGETFKVSYFGSPSVTVEDASGIDPNDGVIASSRFLAFLGRVVSGVNESGVGKVAKVTLPPNTTRQVDIYLANVPYRLKLQMDREPTGQVADIVAIVRYLASREITPEYVDVRVPSKAFYR